MICPKCKKTIKDGSKFCGYCGADIVLAKHSITDADASSVAACAMSCLASGDFDKAKELLEYAMQKEPQNPQVLLGRLLCDLQLRSEAALSECGVDFGENIHYRSLLVFADADTKARLIAAQRKAAEQASVAEKDRKYEEACAALEAEDFEKASPLFEELGDWKDSREKLELCAQGLEQQRIEAEKKAEETRQQEALHRKRIKKYSIIFGAAFALFIIIMLLIDRLIVPATRYYEAEKLLNEGSYEAAYAILEELGDFNDAAQKIPESKYKRAEKAIAEGRYEEAYLLLDQLGDYNDADQLILQSKYDRAKKHIEDGEYEKAISLLSEAYVYSNAAAVMEEVQYQYASQLKANGEYSEAIAVYSDIPFYKDVDEQILSCRYLIAMEHYKENRTYAAYVAFGQLDSYSDASSYVSKIEKQYPTYKFSNASQGDTVEFGKYEQDNNLENGKEALSWIVAKKVGGKMLLVSEKIIDRMPFNEEYLPISWEDSTLRMWLNSTFISSTFTAYEQKAILKSEIDNSESCDDVSNATTLDRVFLLSEDEYDVLEYYIGNNQVTTYAESKDNFGANVSWWLRTVDDVYNDGADVLYWSQLLYREGIECNRVMGIRPAIWVETE